jgi:hypothetical protein
MNGIRYIYLPNETEDDCDLIRDRWVIVRVRIRVGILGLGLELGLGLG